MPAPSFDLWCLKQHSLLCGWLEPTFYTPIHLGQAFTLLLTLAE
jgi:hypothetical protein